MDDRQRKDAGRAGEAAALAHLQSAGLQLVLRNFRCKAGEIDLVMLDGATLVLVEVRYRSSEQFGGAAASVTWRKQRRLANAAEYLLLAHAELRRYPARFDVVAISGVPERRIDWLRSAFTL
jgi:putative endonuclease